MWGHGEHIRPVDRASRLVNALEWPEAGDICRGVIRGSGETNAKSAGIHVEESGSASEQFEQAGCQHTLTQHHSSHREWHPNKTVTKYIMHGSMTSTGLCLLGEGYQHIRVPQRPLGQECLQA